MIDLGSEQPLTESLRVKVQKMSNSLLLSEWKNIRQTNSDCSPKEESNCQECFNKSTCINYLIYEGILSEEIDKRGLRHYAFATSYKKRTEYERFDCEVESLFDSILQNPFPN